MDQKNGRRFPDSTPLYFWFFVDICGYYAEHDDKNNVKHLQITKIFENLRKIEENVRNELAHELTNLTEEKLAEVTKETLGKQYTSGDILKLLQETYTLIFNRKPVFIYDQLNECIVDSLKE